MLCNDAVKTRQKWWKLHLPTLLLLLFCHADCFPKYCFRNFLVDDGFLKILRFRAICELLCRYFFICILNLFCFCLFFIGFFFSQTFRMFPSTHLFDYTGSFRSLSRPGFFVLCPSSLCSSLCTSAKLMVKFQMSDWSCQFLWTHYFDLKQVYWFIL